MNRKKLVEEIRRKQSFLCVGLDTDLNKIPKHLHDADDPIFEFNKQIIDATHEHCVAYKPNTAFYESLGSAGWESLEKTMHYIEERPELFTIADAKRGDIGNTSDMYARAFFESLNFDALTISPYMGRDAVVPYLNYEEKWVVLLALTSNPSAADFETLSCGDGSLYEQVLSASQKWGSVDNMMYVVGATKASELSNIRKIIPEHFLLIPGVGAQGGDLEEVAKNGMTKECGLLVNSSRGIIYASDGEDFAIAAKTKANELQLEMAQLLQSYSS